MGTNYYARVTGGPCVTCGHDPHAAELHIGKGSMGWTFCFRGYREDHTWDGDVLALGVIESVADWKRVLALPNVAIVDEYESAHTAEEFWAYVERKASEEKNVRHTKSQGLWDPGSEKWDADGVHRLMFTEFS